MCLTPLASPWPRVSSWTYSLGFSLIFLFFPFSFFFSIYRNLFFSRDNFDSLAKDFRWLRYWAGYMIWIDEVWSPAAALCHRFLFLYKGNGILWQDTLGAVMNDCMQSTQRPMVRSGLWQPHTPHPPGIWDLLQPRSVNKFFKTKNYRFCKSLPLYFLWVKNMHPIFSSL